MNDQNNNFRIAVILDDLTIEPWQKSIFEAIKDPASFECLLVTHPSSQDGKASAIPEQAGRRDGPATSNRLSAAMDRLERMVSTRLFRLVFGAKRGARDERVKLTDQGGPDTAWQESLNKRGSLSQLQDAELDLILDLRRVPDQTVLAAKARLGRWFIHIGQGAQNTIAPVFPGFWEVCSSTPNIDVQLFNQISPTDLPYPILRGCFRTFLWSWNENERQMRYKAATLVTDMLHQISNRLPAASEAPIPPLEPQAYSTKSKTHSQPPGPVTMALALVKCMWSIGSETVMRTITNERWSLHIAKGSPIDVDLKTADAIEPPSNSYWADPFFIERDGRTYIFFEEYLYPKKKGVISVAQVNKTNGHWSAGDAKIIIERDFHMSYPFIFEHEGDLYMIPESNADNCIGLWKCQSFPDDWQKVSNLMDNVSATDTTLQYHGGKWWMFTNLDRTGLGDHCSELHIFSADNPIEGPWRTHPENPVIRDARCARMAGPLVNTDDHGLIRPAQINERYYGHALALYRVTELSDEHYREELVRRIDPDWRKGIYRNHHVSGIKDYVVVDGCRDQFKFEKFFKPSPTKPTGSQKTSKPEGQPTPPATSGERSNRHMRVNHGQ